MSTNAQRREAIKRANAAVVHGARPLFDAAAPALGYPSDLLELAGEIQQGRATNRQRNMLAKRLPWAEISLPNDTSRADWDLAAGARYAARRAANATGAEAA